MLVLCPIDTLWVDKHKSTSLIQRLPHNLIILTLFEFFNSLFIWYLDCLSIFGKHTTSLGIILVNGSKRIHIYRFSFCTITFPKIFINFALSWWPMMKEKVLPFPVSLCSKGNFCPWKCKALSKKIAISGNHLLSPHSFSKVQLTQIKIHPFCVQFNKFY